ncbi:MAG: caspase family protein [Bacteroidota bacterium]
MRPIGLILILSLLSSLSFTQTQPDHKGRLIINANSHLGRVNDMVFSSSNKLISVSDDKTIRIWDIDDYTSPRVLRPYAEEGFEGRIYSVDVSPDNRFLAVAGFFEKNEIRIIDLFNDDEITVLYGHKDAVNSVRFNSDGSFLASAGRDKNILVWGIDNGKIQGTPVKRFSGHEAPINDLSFFPDRNKVVSCSNDGSVRIWSLEEGIAPIVMKMHVDKVNAIGISKNTNYIVSGGNKGDMILWDSTGTYVKKYKFKSDPIASLDFTLSGKLMVGAKYLGILNAPTSDVKMIMPAVRNVSSVVCSKNLTAYTWAEGNIGVYDHEKQETIFSIESSTIEVNKIGINENGIVVFGDDQLERAFDYKNLQYLWNKFDSDKIKAGTARDNGYQLVQMDELLLSTGFQGKVENDPEIDGPIRSYSILNEHLIAVGSDHSLKLYSRNGTFVKELRGHNGSVKDMVFDREENLLFAVCGDHTIRAWDVNSGVNSFSLFMTSTDEWISWDELGYYEASAGGEKYLGWQIDYSNDRLSDFYRSSTFQSSRHKLKSGEELISSIKNTIQSDDSLPKLNALPEIEWIEPRMYETETATGSVKIKARIDLQSEVESLRIIINGRPLPTKRSAKRYSVVGSEILIEETIDLVGPVNEVQIFLRSEEFRLTSKTRVVKVTSELKSNRGDQNSLQIVNLAQKPDLYLLSIGISEFRKKEYNLTFADDDANSLSSVFTNAPKTVYNNVKSRKLINESATKVNVLNAFDWLTNNVQSNDIACLFIASHGFNKDGEFFILPHDGNPNNLEETTIRWNELSSLLSVLPGKVIVFLDACHSGKLGSNFSQFTSFNTEAIRSISSEENGVVIMAASTGNEVALESEEWGHGAFSLALIEGLEDGKADIKKDGVIYLPELDFYVSERTIELTDGKQHPTTQKPSTISRLPILGNPKH